MEKLQPLMLTLIAHLRSSAAIMEQTAAAIELIIQSEAETPAPVEPEPEIPSPVEPTPEPTPVEPEVPLTIPMYSAPAEVVAPAGQNVVYIPVTLEHTGLERASVIVYRAINSSPATINVGTNQKGYIGELVYTWAKGDDLVHYIRLQFPGSAYRDGQSVRLQLKGIDTKNQWLYLTVTFRDGAVVPDMPEQKHLIPPYNPNEVQSPTDPSAPTPTVPTDPSSPVTAPARNYPATDFSGLQPIASLPIYEETHSWSRSNAYLPSATINGQTTGHPPYVNRDRETGLVTLNAQTEEDGRYRSGFYKFHRPAWSEGLAEAILSSDAADAVLAYYTYHNDTGAEIDWEWIRNSAGVYGFALTLHMPRIGGGSRVSSRSFFLEYSKEDWKTPRRFGMGFNNQRCQWLINGVKVHEVDRISFPTANWDATVVFDTVFSIERHGRWAGEHEYTKPSTMVIHAASVPGL